MNYAIGQKVKFYKHLKKNKHSKWNESMYVYDTKFSEGILVGVRSIPIKGNKDYSYYHAMYLFKRTESRKVLLVSVNLKQTVYVDYEDIIHD